MDKLEIKKIIEKRNGFKTKEKEKMFASSVKQVEKEMLKKYLAIHQRRRKRKKQNPLT